MLNAEVYVAHEWDPLQEVILGGVPPYNQIPRSLIARCKRAISLWWRRAVYANVIKETDHVAALLRERGIKVHRFNEFEGATNMFGCLALFPRDPVLVLGNSLVACAMKAARRRNEIDVIKNRLLSLGKIDEANIIKMPPYKYPAEYYPDDVLLEGGNVLINGNELYVGSMHMVNIPLPWPANLIHSYSLAFFRAWQRILKNGEPLLNYQNEMAKIRSRTYSSKPAIAWLQQQFGNQYTIHEIIIKASFYIDLDGCLAFVRPGLGIICREVIANKLPESIQDWDFIEISLDELQTHAANILSLDPTTVMIDDRNTRVAQELRKRNIDVIEVPFSHVGQYQGSLRCFHQALLRSNNKD